MNKARLEALTDAILAIAATIMVLELTPPEKPELTALFHEWPTLLAYIVSFSLIYLVWFNHHNIFKKANIISQKTFVYNGVWLFFLTLVPFTTAWVGRNPHETIPQVVYLINLMLWSFTFQLMDASIIKDNNTEKDYTTSRFFVSLLYGGILLSMALSFIQPILSLITLLIVIVLLFISMLSGKRAVN